MLSVCLEPSQALYTPYLIEFSQNPFFLSLLVPMAWDTPHDLGGYP